MYSCFTNYLLAKAPYTSGELSKVDAVSYKREVKKGEILFEEGSQWPYNGFVCNGLMHNYTTDLSGKVKTIRFSPEMHWLGDRNSLLTGAQMPHTATALEDSYIVYIENDDFEKLRIVIPRFNDMVHELIQRHIAVAQQRIKQDMALTDEERYAAFLKEKSMLVGRVAPGLIASYLDISPDSMDRIINGIPWNKK